MWLGIWASRRRGEPRWEKFKTRYYEYREEDCVLICVSHHAEIHAIYDRIIQEDLTKVGKPLWKYSWIEAEKLMDKLEMACRQWERMRTPGINSSLYGSYRARQQRKRQNRK